MIGNYTYMRYLFICMVASFCFMKQQMFAHKEPTHHYIIREAYSLLKKHIGASIPEFDTYILGMDGLGREGEFDDGHANPWGYSTMCGGAWSEDHHDPVRNMHEVEMLFRKGMFTSINHFWDPDHQTNGFNSRFELHLPWNPWPTGVWEWNACSLARTYLSDYEHDLMAYKKAMIYLSSKEYAPRLHESYTIKHNGIEFPSPGTFNASLIDWYHGEFTYDDPGIESRKKELIYSIIGRIAHLLGDMSIPAHVKCDEHGLWQDPYENAMNYVEWEGNKESPCIDMTKNIPASPQRVEFWYHDKVFSEKGSIVLPSCSMFPENPYWTYFYSMAQISDHFASNRFHGDDEYLPIGEIASIINSSDKGPTITNFVDGYPELSGYARDESDLNAIRDMTFPYVIRATAGMLYNIALEFALINQKGSKCPIMLAVNDGILHAPIYTFEASDSITVGDNAKPLFISSSAGKVQFKSGKTIRFISDMHAESGSTIHATIEGCSNCYDDPPEQFKNQQIEQAIELKPEYDVLFTWNNQDISNCCLSDPIIALTCMNEKGQTLFASTVGDIISEHDIQGWIYSQQSGLYTIQLESKRGRREVRVIARL